MHGNVVNVGFCQEIRINLIGMTLVTVLSAAIILGGKQILAKDINANNVQENNIY